jgi:hypothetical protein
MSLRQIEQRLWDKDQIDISYGGIRYASFRPERGSLAGSA